MYLYFVYKITHKSNVFNKVRSVLSSKLIVNSLECNILNTLGICIKLEHHNSCNTYICCNVFDNLGIFPDILLKVKSLNNLQ